MFGFIIFILVLSVIGSIFSRPHYGYYRRPRIYPFGGFGYRGWGMGPHYHHHHGPMCHGPHHHHHHHHFM
jgi:hypothetical protein